MLPTSNNIRFFGWKKIHKNVFKIPLVVLIPPNSFIQPRDVNEPLQARALTRSARKFRRSMLLDSKFARKFLARYLLGSKSARKILARDRLWSKLLDSKCSWAKNEPICGRIYLESTFDTLNEINLNKFRTSKTIVMLI